MPDEGQKIVLEHFGHVVIAYQLILLGLESFSPRRASFTLWFSIKIFNVDGQNHRI